MVRFELNLLDESVIILLEVNSDLVSSAGSEEIWFWHM